MENNFLHIFNGAWKRTEKFVRSLDDKIQKR